MVNTAANAEAFVRYANYAPRGCRSFGPTRAALVYGAGYAKQANDAIITLAMVETVEALGNVRHIVATPDLTGVYIGPSDLSLSMGYEPKLDHDEPAVLEGPFLLEFRGDELGVFDVADARRSGDTHGPAVAEAMCDDRG